jgi:hypothetical protein
MLVTVGNEDVVGIAVSVFILPLFGAHAARPSIHTCQLPVSNVQLAALEQDTKAWVFCSRAV